MEYTKSQIIDIVISIKPDLYRLGVEKLGLFGSFVREEQNEESDIDFVVEFQPGMKKYRNYLNLADFLEENLKRKVDLLTWEGMAPFVQREVRKEIEYIDL